MIDGTEQPSRQLVKSGARQGASLFAKQWAAEETTILKSGWDSVCK